MRRRLGGHRRWWPVGALRLLNCVYEASCCQPCSIEEGRRLPTGREGETLLRGTQQGVKSRRLQPAAAACRESSALLGCRGSTCFTLQEASARIWRPPPLSLGGPGGSGRACSTPSAMPPPMAAWSRRRSAPPAARTQTPPRENRFGTASNSTAATSSARAGARGETRRGAPLTKPPAHDSSPANPTPLGAQARAGG